MVMDSSLLRREKLFDALEDFCRSSVDEHRIRIPSTGQYRSGCVKSVSASAVDLHHSKVEAQMLRAANCTQNDARDASSRYYLMLLVAGASALEKARSNG